VVSIISVNYNNSGLSAECLSRTIKILTDNKIVFEVILVDNHSIDGSFEYLTAFFKEQGNVVVLKAEKNGGFGYGNNIGARYAKYDMLWFLNSDAWCTIAQGLNQMRNLILNQYTGLVSNIMKDSDGTVHPNGGAEVTFKYFFLSSLRLGLLFRKNKFIRLLATSLFRQSSYIKASQHNNIDRPVQKQIVSGASVFIEKKKYEKLGGFDEVFFLYDEDTDLCYRATLVGLKNYVTNFCEVATINHSTTSKLSPAMLKKIKLDSRLYFYRKHFTGLRKNCLSLLAKVTWRLL
jgi:GT2 family glycosyltransferase